MGAKPLGKLLFSEGDLAPIGFDPPPLECEEMLSPPPLECEEMLSPPSLVCEEMLSPPPLEQINVNAPVTFCQEVKYPPQCSK